MKTNATTAKLSTKRKRPTNAPSQKKAKNSSGPRICDVTGDAAKEDQLYAAMNDAEQITSEEKENAENAAYNDLKTLGLVAQNGRLECFTLEDLEDGAEVCFIHWLLCSWPTIVTGFVQKPPKAAYI